MPCCQMFYSAVVVKNFGVQCLEDAFEAERGGWLQNVEFGMGGSDELQELFRVLADEGLGVVAGDVVPLDAALVDVVQDA